jgi:hypothetical protein
MSRGERGCNDGEMRRIGELMKGKNYGRLDVNTINSD